MRSSSLEIIARGGGSEYRVVIVKVTDKDGMEGLGEASPSKFYGETADTVLAALERLKPVIESADPWSLESIETEMSKAIGRNGSAKAAMRFLRKTSDGGFTGA